MSGVVPNNLCDCFIRRQIAGDIPIGNLARDVRNRRQSLSDTRPLGGINSLSPLRFFVHVRSPLAYLSPQSGAPHFGA